MELTLFDRRITIDFREILQRFGLLLVFFLLCAVLAVLSDRFLTISNLVNVLRQSAINGIIAIGMTYVILTGGIDLSVGSVLALSTVITASLLQSDVPVPLAFVAGLAVGGVLGLVNGVIITKLHIPPFITTLGMLVIARGLALTYTQGRSITGLPQVFRFIGTGFIGPIPMPIILLAATFLIAVLILNRTRIGQYIYAIGNNPVAARFAGIPVDRYVTLVYALSGVLAALAGMILIGRLGSAQPTAGEAYEFDAIAAVVVGGTSFTGGEGGLGGTLIGALIIAVLNNGLNLLNVSSFFQPVVTGVVIALALLFYRAIR